MPRYRGTPVPSDSASAPPLSEAGRGSAADRPSENGQTDVERSDADGCGARTPINGQADTLAAGMTNGSTRQGRIHAKHPSGGKGGGPETGLTGRRSRRPRRWEADAVKNDLARRG